MNRLPLAARDARLARWAGDIRAWIVLLLLVRLVGITTPPLENTHSWRQAFTNMISRNLAEGPFDLVHPRTDMAGERPDVVASEFPGLNAIIAVVYRWSGPAHWYGRLIVLLVSSLGVWAFHCSVRRHYDERVAFLASFTLLWSSWFIYGRKSMPDAFSIALALIAFEAVDRALVQRDGRWFLLAVPIAALGGLCKIPAVVLFAPWGLMVLRKDLPMRWRISSGVSLLLAMMPVLWWYFLWQPHLLHTYHNQLYFPYGLWDGLMELRPYAMKALERFRFSALTSHVAFAAMLFGLYRSIRSADQPMLLLTMCIALPFGYFILKTGSVFALHAYYILPLVPLMALLAGVGLCAVPQGRWTLAVLVLLVVEAAGMRWEDLRGGSERAYLLRAEELADRFTADEDLVATPAGLDPRPMYFLHRHGWSLKPEPLSDRAVLDSLQKKGLVAVFVDRHTQRVQVPWPLLHEDADWQVFGPHSGTP